MPRDQVPSSEPVAASNCVRPESCPVVVVAPSSRAPYATLRIGTSEVLPRPDHPGGEPIHGHGSRSAAATGSSIQVARERSGTVSAQDVPPGVTSAAEAHQDTEHERRTAKHLTGAMTAIEARPCARQYDPRDTRREERCFGSRRAERRHDDEWCRWWRPWRFWPGRWLRPHLRGRWWHGRQAWCTAPRRTDCCGRLAPTAWL